MYLNFLFKTFFAFSSFLGVMDQDGWVEVKKPQKTAFEESLEELDPSIWVVFSQKIRGEQFFVRFPEDPTYNYKEEGKIQIQASKEGRDHLLWVFEKSLAFERIEELKKDLNTLLIFEKKPGPNICDYHYYKEGKWIWERVYESPKQIFFFQTVSEEKESSFHQEFIESFEVLSK